MDNWPEIKILLDEANLNGDNDKFNYALSLIEKNPSCHGYFYDYLLQHDLAKKNEINKLIKWLIPTWEVLFNIHIPTARPSLDFIRKPENGLPFALVTVELTVRRLVPLGDDFIFRKFKEPVIVTSMGEALKCDSSNLSKLHLTARTVPSYAPDRWHPQDVQRYITSMKNDISPAPHLSSVFDLIRASFMDYVYFEKSIFYDFMSVYIIATYFYPLFQAFPLLVLYGPTESGKSLTMQIIEHLAFNAMMVTDPTPATLFRVIEELGPTMLMDEIEGLASRRDYASSIMSILRASYKPIDVPRMEEKTKGVFRLRLFCCYGPKVIGTIQGIENVLSNRSVIINLMRRRPEDDNKFKTTDPDLEHDLWRQLRNALYLLVMTRWQELNSLIPSTIKELEGILANRQLELWTPFLSIANWIDQSREDRGRALFSSLLEMAHEKSKERQMIDREANQTLMVLQAILQMVKPDSKAEWHSSLAIKEQLDKFFTEPQPWINETWIGRMMTQIGITKRRRRNVKSEFLGEKTLTHYWIDPGWLKDYCDRYGVDMDDWK